MTSRFTPSFLTAVAMLAAGTCYANEATHSAKPNIADALKGDNAATVELPKVTQPGAATVSEPTEGFRKEKCFGLAKAGMNDCASPDGSHACAGYGKTDGNPYDWILLPAGVCQKINGGNLSPKG